MPAGVPVLDGLGIGVEHAALGEGHLQPGKVALEVVRHEHRRAAGLLDDLVQGLELFVVDFLPVAGVVGVGRAVGELQALAGAAAALMASMPWPLISANICRSMSL
jgi:hypothetical protein